MNYLDKSLAKIVAEAQTEYDEAVARKAEAQKRIDGLANRVAELKKQHEQLRAEEKHPELYAVKLDMDDTESLLSEAQSEANRLNVDAKRLAMEKAEREWEKHKNQALLESAQEKVKRIEVGLIDSVRQLAELGKSVGKVGRAFEVWRPSQELTRLVNVGDLPMVG